MLALLTQMQQNAILVDILGAMVVHATYRRYEVDPANVIPTSLLLLCFPSITTYLLVSSYGSILKAAFTAFATFFATLLSSITFYRISPFHPLARYPGPFLAKISKFHALRIMATGKNHLYHKELHEKYGPYVRVGPNELSVLDGDYISDVLGAPGLPKGPMWDGRGNPNGIRSLIATRNQREHTRRRKPWNRAFSMAAVRDYEPTLHKRASQLLREMEKRAKAGTVLNFAEWMKSFTFDFMGDMIFGGGFETMRDGVDSEPILEALEGGLKFIGLLHHVPWMTKLLHMFIGSSNSIGALRTRAVEIVNKRRVEGSQVRDVYYYLIDEEGNEKERPTEGEVISDGLTAIIAGYDTTASVLTALFYHVLTSRDVYIRLQSEVDELFRSTDGSQLNPTRLAGLPYLNAVINEALRLGCPVDVIQRATTSDTGGKLLGTNYIPAGTSVGIPLYTLLRSPTCFSPAPEEFRPERFLDASVKDAKEKVRERQPALTNLAAFIPFSFGPENCAGKSLAMVELRVVTALVMRHFDMKLAEGYDPVQWHDQLQDWFIMSIGPLPVQLTLRIPVLD